MISAFFRFLFGGCDHKYIIYKEYTRTSTYENMESYYPRTKKTINSTIIVSRCEKCGKISEYEVG